MGIFLSLGGLGIVLGGISLYVNIKSYILTDRWFGEHEDVDISYCDDYWRRLKEESNVGKIDFYWGWPGRKVGYWLHGKKQN